MMLALLVLRPLAASRRLDAKPFALTGLSKMISQLRWPAVVVGLILAAGTVEAQQVDAVRAPEVLAQFKRDLKEALRAGLSRGPVEAIESCHTRAPEVATGLSKKGLRVGRTSHRLRNPANVPPEWVRPILEDYLANPSKRSPRATRLSDGRSGYVEPILMQPLCSTCHGSSISSEVAARIKELYPRDEAVGFEVGDLRGVFWVEQPVSE